MRLNISDRLQQSSGGVEVSATTQLLDISLAMMREQDPERLVVKSSRLAQQCIDFDLFRLAWKDSEHECCTVRSLFDRREPGAKSSKSQYTPCNAMIKDVQRTQKSRLLERSECQQLDSHSPFQSGLLVPAVVDGNAHGALLFARTQGRPFTKRDISVMDRFAAHFATALRAAHTHRSLSQWEAIARSTDAAILSKGLDGRITQWNPAASQMFGYSAHEMIDGYVDHTVPQDKHDELNGLLTIVRQGRHVQQIETRRRTKCGKEIDVSLTISPVLDSNGTVVGSSTIARDITAAKRADERFRLAVESAPNAMVLLEDGVTILMVNAAAERLFGYSRGELLGQSVDLFVPARALDNHRRKRAEYLRAPDRRDMIRGGDLTARRKDGSEVPVEIGLTPIAHGSKMWILASVVDISARIQAEEERKKFIADLREAVEARDAFLSIASHELKTPLTALQLTVQAFMRTLKKTHQPEIATEMVSGRLTTTARQVARLTTLVDQLLDVSRITSDRLSLECETVEIGTIICGVVERFAEAGAVKPGQVTFELSENIYGYWDRERIDQILTNLLSNAVKYGKDKPVEIHALQSDNAAIVRVRDHGMGIAPEHQAKIFGRFERVVSDREYGGFGLGLWIVRQFVEAHGGTIRVDSKPAKGSLFEVFLPIQPEGTVASSKGASNLT